ncbi:MAG: hypothetical protein RJA21_272, partial [Gemmatimonadota bacterium]
MTADDPRSAVLAHRAQVLQAAGHALERSVRRRGVRRRLSSAGIVALLAVGALVAGWPRPAVTSAPARRNVALTVLRGGESPANVTVIRGGQRDTIALRPIGDDELDAELLSAFGQRFGAVGVIRQGRMVAVIDA